MFAPSYANLLIETNGLRLGYVCERITTVNGLDDVQLFVIKSVKVSNTQRNSNSFPYLARNYALGSHIYREQTSCLLHFFAGFESEQS